MPVVPVPMACPRPVGREEVPSPGCAGFINFRSARFIVKAPGDGDRGRTVTMDAVDVPHPSDAVRSHVGTGSVAEAAALLAAGDFGGGVLVVPKLRGEHVTVAVAELISLSDPLPLTISSACTACGACLLTCPERALRAAPQRPVVVATCCTSCGECVEICPADAITLREEPGDEPASRYHGHYLVTRTSSEATRT